MVRQERARNGTLDRMVEHIAFAERWLARAREECAQGNVTRSVLTLLLAEAEVHHARESTSRPPAAHPRRRNVSAAVLPLAVAAALLVGVRLWPQPPVPDMVGATGPVLRFRHPVGRILALVPTTPNAHGSSETSLSRTHRALRPVSVFPASTPPARRVPVLSRVSAPPATGAVARGQKSKSVRKGASTGTRGRAQAARSSSSRPAFRRASNRSAVGTRPLVSQADLIDLVLAAERSLRTGSK